MLSVTDGADIERQRAMLLALSDERDTWHRWVWEMWTEGYRIGRREGWQRGWAEGYGRSDAEWLAALDPAKKASGTLSRLPSHAELERRRWGPGGREHFADPRPGEYTGGPVEWDGGQHG
jgi:hypothetical protein